MIAIEEKKFTSKFLESFNKVVMPFKSKEILVLIDLQTEESLEEITKRETTLTFLKDLAIKHYTATEFGEYAIVIRKGFEMILEQIHDLKNQALKKETLGPSEKVQFNSIKFGEGYGKVMGALTHILQKHS